MEKIVVLSEPQAMKIAKFLVRYRGGCVVHIRPQHLRMPRGLEFSGLKAMMETVTQLERLGDIADALQQYWKTHPDRRASVEKVWASYAQDEEFFSRLARIDEKLRNRRA